LGATYFVTLQQNGQFCVEIVTQDSLPTTVFNFATKATAKEWIANHSALLAKSPTERRRAFYIVTAQKTENHQMPNGPSHAQTYREVAKRLRRQAALA
jgi:hypothetical protein